MSRLAVKYLYKQINMGFTRVLDAGLSLRVGRRWRRPGGPPRLVVREEAVCVVDGARTRRGQAEVGCETPEKLPRSPIAKRMVELVSVHLETDAHIYTFNDKPPLSAVRSMPAQIGIYLITRVQRAYIRHRMTSLRLRT